MKTTVELLDAARAARQLTSDYQLAAILETTTQRVSNWRTGRHTMDNAAAVRIAALLNRPALEIVAIVEAERAQSAEQKRFWRQVAASAAAVAVVMLFAPDQLAALLPIGDAIGAAPTLYIMSTVAAASLAAILAAFFLSRRRAWR